MADADRGPQGEAGVPGRQGAAGTTGRRGMALSNSRMLAIFLVVVVAFLALAVRQEIQQRQIRSNNARIELLFYGQCVDRRADVLRQNALIDNAIAAEKRKPGPDRKRIADLSDFRNTVPACGTPPGR